MFDRYFQLTVNDPEKDRKLNLTFLDYDVADETRRRLEKVGLEVDFPRHGYTLERNVEGAVASAEAWFFN